MLGHGLLEAVPDDDGRQALEIVFKVTVARGSPQAPRDVEWRRLPA